MHEDIFAGRPLYKAVSLCPVEPLHYASFLHSYSPYGVCLRKFTANEVMNLKEVCGATAPPERSSKSKYVLWLWQDLCEIARKKLCAARV